MPKNKTLWTEKSVTDFINDIPDENKRKDSLLLVDIFKKETGFEPKMWGPTIIGFGSYHYKYESGHEGDAPIAGFSPRKAAISLYVTCDAASKIKLLKKFGKHTTGKGCIYFKKLADINIDVLKKMIKGAIEETEKQYPQSS